MYGCMSSVRSIIGVTPEVIGEHNYTPHFVCGGLSVSLTTLIGLSKKIFLNPDIFGKKFGGGWCLVR